MNNADLHIKDRTFDFALRIIKLVNSLPRSNANSAISNQLIRSGTSIGANMEEAQGAFSKKDFIHCVQISLKESRETLYWIKIISESKIIPRARLEVLIDENEQIIKILTTILKHAKLKRNE